MSLGILEVIPLKHIKEKMTEKNRKRYKCLCDFVKEYNILILRSSKTYKNNRKK